MNTERGYKKGQHMKRRKKFILLLALLTVLLCLTGCAGEDLTEEPEQQEKQEGLQIGMSFDSFVIERWLRDRDFFVLTAQDLGAEVNVQVANGDPAEQASQIEYFIKKGVDVIVVIAVDGEKLSDAITEAKNAGIKVISYDRLITNANTDLYISFDNEMIGRLMGEAMVTALPEGGNIFTINGSPADQNVAMVVKGFQDAIEGSGLNIVYTNYCDNWLAELAFDAVEEGLSTTPRNLVGVMCGNDDLASQAFRALAENRLAGKVVLVGQDADLSACQRIVEGTQYMTVYKSVEQLAQKAAEFACALGYQKMLEEGRITKGEIPEVAMERVGEIKDLKKISDVEVEGNKNIYMTADGDGKVTAVIDEGNVPYYSIEPVAVTKENMDEVVIGSDFHTEDEVYLNVEKKSQ